MILNILLFIYINFFLISTVSMALVFQLYIFNLIKSVILELNLNSLEYISNDEVIRNHLMPK